MSKKALRILNVSEEEVVSMAKSLQAAREKEYNEARQEQMEVEDTSKLPK